MVLTAAVAVPAPAHAARVHMIVTPATISPGGAIRVRAASSPCLPGDQIILISSAFRGHAYGEGAVYGPVGRHGAFSVPTRLRAALHPGRYEIGGRCGGGNLGVSVALVVR
jgi:hypothetical protein